MRDPIRALRSLMPEHVRKQMEELDAQEEQLAEQIRRNSAEAIEALASAIRSPRVARIDLEAAARKVTAALALAIALEAE